jgi:hypothetical protein
MKTLCPNCHSSATYQVSHQEMTDAIHELSETTAIIGMSIGLCRSLKIHTSVGIIAGTVLSVLIHMARSNDSNALSYQPYCCQNCQHIFTP